ncbi:MAG: hypothetical protein QOI36_2488, partial [Pseudonocardiales bacterium]|nr:hypothetical protein [Pseudonocardiales bacterium]
PRVVVSVVVEMLCCGVRLDWREEEPADLVCGVAVELGNVGGVDLEGERHAGWPSRVLTIFGLMPARSAIVA